jgi:hypothetical protein
MFKFILITFVSTQKTMIKTMALGLIEDINYLTDEYPHHTINHTGLAWALWHYVNFLRNNIIIKME